MQRLDASPGGVYKSDLAFDTSECPSYDDGDDDDDDDDGDVNMVAS